MGCEIRHQISATMEMDSDRRLATPSLFTLITARHSPASLINNAKFDEPKETRWRRTAKGEMDPVK